MSNYKNISTKENEDNNEILQVFEDFTLYVAQPSPTLEAVFNNQSFNPETWWLIHGRNKFPVLAKLASRIFSIPTSSASSERVWSVFDLIHTKQHCKLKNETVNKLVFVYINSQLEINQNDEAASIDYFLNQINDEEDNGNIHDDESDVDP